MAQAPLAAPSLAGPLILLALDGGGIRGVSELLVLKEIMSRIQHDLTLAGEPRPCEYFHLVGGTSTGGLIGLMLFRLQMTVTDALKQYNNLAKRIFSSENMKTNIKQGQPKFKATTLETAFKELIAEKALGERMLDPTRATAMGRSFVCAMPSVNMARPRNFRTYTVRANSSVDCRIWEAARATTAAVTFFKPIDIGEEGMAKETFIDAGIKCNNPAKEVLREAKDTYDDPARQVCCLVSIGAGDPGPIGIKTPTAFQNLLGLHLVNVLKDIATDCETTHKELSERFEDVPRFYFRFNVTHGVGEIVLDEWDKMGDITTHTKAYISESLVTARINALVQVILGRGRQTMTIGNACGIMQISDNLTDNQTFSFPPRGLSVAKHYRDPAGVLNVIKDSYVPKRSKAGRVEMIVLYGLPGTGKSQACQKFFESNVLNFPIRVWIDASSATALQESFLKLADELSLNTTGPAWRILNAVRVWFEKREQPWLLVFDDIPPINKDFKLDDYLPSSGFGCVIVTSGEELKSINAKLVKIEPMDPTYAQSLLLDILARTKDDVEAPQAMELVQKLGCLPLAINVAGSFINESGFTIKMYLDEWQTSILNKDDNIQWDSSGYQKSVFSAFDVTYKRILKEHSSSCCLEVLQLLAFLDPKLVSERVFVEGNRAASRLVETKKAAPDQLKALQLRVIHGLPGQTQSTLRGALIILKRYSLLSFEGETTVDIATHSLVHAWVHEYLTTEERQQWWRKATFLLALPLPHPTDAKFNRSNIPHLDHLRKKQPTEGSLFELRWPWDSDDRFDLISTFADTYSKCGYINKACNLREDICTIMEGDLSSVSPASYIEALCLLADSFSDSGRPSKSILKARKALEFAEGIQDASPLSPLPAFPLPVVTRLAQYSKDSKWTDWLLAAVAENMDNISHELGDEIIRAQTLAAELLNDSDCPQEALVSSKRLLAAATAQQEQQIDLSGLMSEIGRSYSILGQHWTATDLYQKVLAQREKFDPNHPNFFAARQDVLNSYAQLIRHCPQQVPDGLTSSSLIEMRKVLVRDWDRSVQETGQRYIGPATAHANLARSLMDADRIAETIDEYQVGLDKSCGLHETTETFVAQTRLALMMALDKAGEHDKASDEMQKVEVLLTGLWKKFDDPEYPLMPAMMDSLLACEDELLNRKDIAERISTREAILNINKETEFSLSMQLQIKASLARDYLQKDTRKDAKKAEQLLLPLSSNRSPTDEEEMTGSEVDQTIQGLKLLFAACRALQRGPRILDPILRSLHHYERMVLGRNPPLEVIPLTHLPKTQMVAARGQMDEG